MPGPPRAHKNQNAPPGRPIPDDTELGPAMTKLTLRQRAFVIELFMQPVSPRGKHPVDYVKAAKAAGYEGTENGIRVYASRLAHSDRIQDAIREEAKRQFGATLPEANDHLLRAMRDKRNPSRQLAAIKRVQELGGLVVTQKHEIVHKHDRASMIAEIRETVEQLRALGVRVDMEALLPPGADAAPALPEGLLIDVTPLQGVEDGRTED
jgi:hypothetical protein